MTQSLRRKAKSRSQPKTRSDGASLWSNSTGPQPFPSGTDSTVVMRYTPRVTLCKFLALGRMRWTVGMELSLKRWLLYPVASRNRPTNDSFG